MTQDPSSFGSQPGEPGLTGPLMISTIRIPDVGQIGLTNCPGRRHVDAEERHWRRDLSADLAAILDWGARGIVSLNEAHEFPRLGVADLPEKMQASSLRWFHLPVPDMQAPGESFTLAWREHGLEILDILARGDRLVIHCAAGLGRSGMVAAKILTTYGMQPEPAIALVRKCRPGAIETEDQAQYVLTGPKLTGVG